MKVLFIDLTCKIPYDHVAFATKPLAGTEISVIQIAEMLSKTHQVFVAQHCRDHSEFHSNNASYVSLDYVLKKPEEFSPDVVILLRKYQELDKYGSLFPHAKKIFWHHDLARYKMRKWRWAFRKHNCPIIAVSEFHKKDIEEKLRGRWHHRLYDHVTKQYLPKVIKIYNPLPDDLHPDDTPVNKHKLVFFSSPNKGLDETLRYFLALKKVLPEYHLYITNPGYIEIDGCKQLDKKLLEKQGITILGILNFRQDVIQHVREAFCVFYPQKYKAENFGFIYAEANAVGTPVLAHDFGAAAEVLSNSEQLIDVNQADAEKQIIKKLQEWQTNGRPKVYAKEEYRASAVIKEWEELLAE